MEQKSSSGLLSLLIISSLIFLVNLLVLTHYTSLLDPYESFFFWKMQTMEQQVNQPISLDYPALLPEWLGAIVWRDFGFNIIFMRLVSIGLSLFSLWGILHWGRQLFGRTTAKLWVIVLISSLLFPFLSKYAVTDSWIFAVGTFHSFFMILYLKKSHIKWSVGVWISLLLGAMILSVSMVIWSLVLYGMLRFLHPQGKQLDRLWLLPIWMVLIAVLFFTDKFALNLPSAIFDFQAENLARYPLYMLIGILPWIAFFPSGIRELVSKVRKEEELSIILFSLLVASFLSGTFGFQCFLAFLVAKQLQNYFKEGFPYSPWVQTTAILHLVFALIAAIWFIIQGVTSFREAGLSSTATAGAIYWVGSFIGVIGIFMKKFRVTLISIGSAGLLFTFFNWLLVIPLLEQYNQKPRAIFEEIRAEREGEGTINIYTLKEESFAPSLSVWANDADIKLTPIPADLFLKTVAIEQDALFLARSLPDQPPGAIDTLNSFQHYFQQETVYLLKIQKDNVEDNEDNNN